MAASQPVNQHDCVICLDTLLRSNLISLPCNHYLCGPCTQRGWSLALKNESFFPFTCCDEPIPCSTVAKFINADDRIAYNAKREEYYTVGPRTYCSYPTCSTFIPPILIEGRIALCPKCQKWTCRKCQAPDDHVPYANCPASATSTLESLKKLAKERGWQMCPNCGDLRELIQGCFHITCICNAEFCYLCQARWKTCECPRFTLEFVVDELRAPRLGARWQREVVAQEPPRLQRQPAIVAQEPRAERQPAVVAQEPPRLQRQLAIVAQELRAQRHRNIVTQEPQPHQQQPGVNAQEPPRPQRQPAVVVQEPPRLQRQLAIVAQELRAQRHRNVIVHEAQPHQQQPALD
ncbi:MAG: hypothetical protein M1836_002542 [Candelina mexicana]|nr:MAG: hypothetical protein M1836_002542 [Candelina mexicana]